MDDRGDLGTLWDFISDHRADIAYTTYQHFSLVVQCLILATFVAVVLAALIVQVGWLEPVAGAVSAIGLTIPSFALVGLLIPTVGLGNEQAVIAVTFYAILPILRNAVVGLAGVDKNLLESARGMGMSPLRTLLRVQLPLAWPVILAGMRISMQMSMGVAAIAAYALGPGLGKYIFDALAHDTSPDAVNYALVGTFGIILVAVIADLLLLLLGRVTVSKGIRTA